MTDYAHLRNTSDKWFAQSIAEHCNGTASLARQMAHAFQADAWAWLCGKWHDIGKYSAAFQQHIKVASGYSTGTDPGKTDHSTAGALWSFEQLRGNSLPIAYCISGHHSGLMDYDGGGRQTLQFHLFYPVEKKLLDEVRPCIQPVDLPKLTRPAFMHDGNPFKSWHLWIRMLYSCLVDADRLDTERFMNPEKFALRNKFSTLTELKTRLDAHMRHIAENARNTAVNRIRQEVQSICRTKGTLPQGIYSLTVPTGGGKTLSSLVWAMEHAMKHHLNRIIIAIPYTSIVTQTANTLREIFGEQNVVEHHSYVDVDSLPDKLRNSMELATENWDAPIIVTTNVQLFESLFSNKPSRCRKLHNIASSVVILDEVQTLPVENLRPIVDVMQSLATCMHTSMLLTTATQPALAGRIGSGQGAFNGLEITELIPDTERLFNNMRRVRLHFEPDATDISSVASEMVQHSQILCVVNTRNEAKAIYEALPDKSNAFHLSRMMCQQHISNQLAAIRTRLVKGEPVRVVSTQLIEAGVDIDFPVVWREMAGLDSIAQAAGRCNREGLQAMGTVTVFKLQKMQLRGVMAKAEAAAQDLLDMGQTDFLSPQVAHAYFRRFYAKINNPNAKGITDDLYQLKPQFATAARNFSMIDDNTITVYVPYGDGEALINQLRNGNYSRDLLRKLQRYSVSLPVWKAEQLALAGAEKLSDYIYVLPNREAYDSQTGLQISMDYLNHNLII